VILVGVGDIKSFYEDLRRSLKDLEERVIKHPMISEALEGRLSIDAIKRFAINQWYIVNHDLRSLAVMLSRARDMDEIDYFKAAVDVDYRALQELKSFLIELGIEPVKPSEASVRPMAVAYTHYISWLSQYASPGVIAFAFAVNFPTWGQASSTLGDALEKRYGYKNLGFFKIFSPPYDQFIERSLAIASKYYPAEKGSMAVAATLIQKYEGMFWDSVYGDTMIKTH